ncbi:MAG TPA: hypothetical protein VKA44_08955 [Gemmatimonadota bacterium]|nr:hypothetical protein [Gemmatimonadota bacterium]
MRTMVMLALGLAAALTAVPGPGTPAPAVAGSSASPDTVAKRCADARRHEFDFWLGTWTVRDSAGAEVGRSRISRTADGCGIMENWTGSDGVSGTSLNVYDPESGHWRQFWVGGRGLVLRLSGGLEGTSMVLAGRHRSRSGTDVMDRIRWTPLDEGGVRQTWSVSTDGGESWRVGFDGWYVAR